MRLLRLVSAPPVPSSPSEKSIHRMHGTRESYSQLPVFDDSGSVMESGVAQPSGEVSMKALGAP